MEIGYETKGLNLNECQRIMLDNLDASFRNGMRCAYVCSKGDAILAARLASQHVIQSLESIGYFE